MIPSFEVCERRKGKLPLSHATKEGFSPLLRCVRGGGCVGRQIVIFIINFDGIVMLPKHGLGAIFHQNFPPPSHTVKEGKIPLLWCVRGARQCKNLGIWLKHNEAKLSEISIFCGV